MEISKSTPYVRYRENISSTLHKGTIHIESEYLDRERKTTIESIEGQTWQNMVNGENKEEDILPRLGLKIEGNEDVLDTVEQHMPIDTIIGDIEPVANEDGTYTYEISTMEGSYAKILDGQNNFSLTSDGLVGDMYIKYNAQGEETNGNIVMNGQSSYTIENSNNGEIKSAILRGQTLVNTVAFKQVNTNASFDNATNVITLVDSTGWIRFDETRIKPSTKYIIIIDILECTLGSDSKPLKISLGDGTLNTVNITSEQFKVGRIIVTETTPSTILTNYFNAQTRTGSSCKFKLMIIEYQDGMENWDIPYFEGMQSVENPTVIISNSPVQFGKGGRL